MIDLEVGVVTRDPRDALQRGAIVTISRLADLAGKKDAQTAKLTKVIDIVRGEPNYMTFPLEHAGIYELTMRSPSGVETRELTLQSSIKLLLEIRPRREAEAVERWQDFGDIVFSPILPSELTPPPFRVPERYDVIGLRDFIRYGQVFNAFDFLTTRPIVQPTFSDFADPNLLSHSDHEFGRTDSPAVVVPRFSQTATIDTPAYNELRNLYFTLRGVRLDEAIPARWTNSFGRNGRDLVSIPWTWFPLVDEPNRNVEIKLRQRKSNAGSTTVLEVLDTKWGALLDFVTQGRMEEASKVADSLMSENRFGPSMSLPEFALQGKLMEPLVAVLGGIILVSNTVELRMQRWDAWLENLANWFPNMPDAAAIYGYRLLQKGETEAASHWLRRSVTEGFPFFSATFRLLMLGFSQLEDQESLDLVAPAAAAVDVTQPFTVIHVPWGVATPNPTPRQAQG